MKAKEIWSHAKVVAVLANILLWMFLGVYSLTLKPTFTNLEGYYDDDYDLAPYEVVYENAPGALKAIVPAYRPLMLLIEPFDEGKRGHEEVYADLIAVAMLVIYIYLRISSLKEFNRTGRLLRTEGPVLFVLDLLIFVYLVIGIALIVPLTV